MWQGVKIRLRFRFGCFLFWATKLNRDCDQLGKQCINNANKKVFFSDPVSFEESRDSKDMNISRNAKNRFFRSY